MSTIGQMSAAVYTANTTNTAKTKETTKTSSYGNTIGDVQLSDKAAKYYEELKAKYSDMDFVLVANDEVDGAEQKAAQYANGDKIQVLIDVDKIEQMAEDEEYRDKYETIIENGRTQLDSMKDTLGSLVGDVKTYGIKIDDNGNASYYAVVDQSLSAQKERIEKKAEEKKTEKKKAQKEAAETKKEEAAEEKRAESAKGDTVTVTASTVEELKTKLTEQYFNARGSQIMTEQEKQVGTTIDFKL